MGDRFNIGGILLDTKTGFRNGGGPFYVKRIESAYLTVGVSESGADFEVEFYRDSDQDNPIADKAISIVSGATFDVDDFDEADWPSASVQQFRIPIRKVGYSWQTRVSHMSSGEQLFLQRLGIQWLAKTKKTSQRLG
jgi:hypothetical protein